jgi:hypothetical protein
LKPDLIMPLIHTLPLEQCLASYLPEVYNSLEFLFPLVLHLRLQFTTFTAYKMQGPWTPEDIMELLQSPPFCQQVDSFTYVIIWIPTYLLLQDALEFSKDGDFPFLPSFSHSHNCIGTSNGTGRFGSVWN